MNRFLRFVLPALIGAAGWAAIAHLDGPAARADSTFTYTAPTGRFIVRSITISPGIFQTVRIDSTTGDCWYAASGKWIKFTDDTAPGPGAYDLQLVSMNDGKTYQVIRTELSTGRTWYLNVTKWQLITEP